MEVHVETYPLAPNVLGVALEGEIDLATVNPLKERLYALVDAHRNLILNLRGVAYIDSSGLAALLAVMKRVRESGGQLSVASPSGHVGKLLTLTGLDTAIDVHASEADALQQMQAALGASH